MEGFDLFFIPKSFGNGTPLDFSPLGEKWEVEGIFGPHPPPTLSPSGRGRMMILIVGSPFWSVMPYRSGFKKIRWAL
jgi:hypothetical protein